MTFAHLDDEALNEVREAAIDLGFADTDALRTLTADISPRFVASVMVGGNGLARLNNLTVAMNQTRVLTSGEVPLTKFLANAAMLAGGREEELVFRRALELVSADGLASPATGGRAPAAATADVRDVPHRDGALEIAIEQDDTIEVGFLHAGAVASRSVAKLMVHRHFDGAASFLAGNKPDLALGTGWVLAPRLVVTNHHVVNARLPLEPPAGAADFALQGAATTVLFDFYLATSATLTTTSLACVASDQALDFAILRLPDDAPDRPPLRLRGNAITKPKERALQERVNVLQHPDGNPMRLGFRNNFVVTGAADRLSYLTDTAGGSSGSPICDDAWFVAGLHRGWSTIAGGPVTVWGREIRQENYGTPVTAILAHLEAAHPELLAEIQAGQAALG